MFNAYQNLKTSLQSDKPEEFGKVKFDKSYAKI